MPVSRYSDRNRDFDVPGLPAMKVAVRMHMPTKSVTVFFFRDGIVPSDAHLQMELVVNETSGVVVGSQNSSPSGVSKNSSSTPLKRAQLQHRHAQVKAHGVKARTSVVEPTTSLRDNVGALQLKSIRGSRSFSDSGRDNQ